MDTEAFLVICDKIMNLRMYPYFELAHCVVTCMCIKEDLAEGSHLFSRKHPFSCWISCMLAMYSGAILTNFLLGESIISAYNNENFLILAIGAWYVIFYAPFDIGYRVFNFLPVKLVLAVMKEVIRCKKIHDGVIHAANIYPNSFLIMIVIGTLKGNGYAFLKIFERLLRGVWSPNSFETMQLSFSTKLCIVASIVFIFTEISGIISVPDALIYFGVLTFFVYCKIEAMLYGIHDWFVPFEKLFCVIFLGGLWDKLGHIHIPANKNSRTFIKKERNVKMEWMKKKE
ncbi:trimeric intracellular cation channel type 1B.1 [Trichonephila inaurata madagascariensis]|uniref:Trimeric intracellular cation channel type 1B.1 n=1 Tax=Trichonephila inaurata madagascariensis TaxID=2747483 RepID=A0A8X6X589_9ARAC|nr:trimeric intracellular cation channel type 1B.1 [Trichonephila inaurata madagascariensis]